MRRVIERVRRQRIVVAGQEHDGALPVAPSELLEHAVPPLLVRVRAVEEIAGAQHGIDVAALGKVQDASHHFEPGPGEAQFLFAAERREAQAQVPVCSVQQGQRHIVLLSSLPSGGIAGSVLGHAISNSAVSSLSTVGKA